MVGQEEIMQLSMLQQEAGKLDEHLRAIDQQILEMQELDNSLDEIEEKGGDMLAGLGKGIYIETEIKNKNLFVNVGNNTIVRKSVPETKEVIGEELKKLSEGKEHITMKIMELQQSAEELVGKIQASEGAK